MRLTVTLTHAHGSVYAHDLQSSTCPGRASGPVHSFAALPFDRVRCTFAVQLSRLFVNFGIEYIASYESYYI